MLTRLASTYFLATLLGNKKKKQSASVSMAGEKPDPSKVDPSNTISISYEDLSEEQRQKFEAELNRQNEEIKAKMLACFEKTWQGVIEKENVMPSIPSTTPPASYTTTSASPTLDVSPPKDPLVKFLREFGDKLRSHKWSRKILYLT